MIVSIEDIGFQELWKMWLMEKIALHGLTINVHGYRESTRTKKHYRIEKLRPKFQRHEVRMARGLDALYQELREYPEPVHDDVLDSLAQHFEVSRPARDVTAIEDLLPPWDPEQNDKPTWGMPTTGLGASRFS